MAATANLRRVATARHVMIVPEIELPGHSSAALACYPELLCPNWKSPVEKIPADIFANLGYGHMIARGQKGYNGVAILSKLPLEDITHGLLGDDSDEQARWIEATVMGDKAVRVCGLYLPNGNPAPGPKYDYKLRWMDRLKARAEDLLADEMPALIAGDFNIIPQDEDAKRPEAWTEDALARPESRAAYLEKIDRMRGQGPLRGSLSCSNLAPDAIRAAIEDYRARRSK